MDTISKYNGFANIGSGDRWTAIIFANIVCIDPSVKVQKEVDVATQELNPVDNNEKYISHFTK